MISEEIFEDFELELEWKVEEGGNSGVFYFATEKSDEIWHTAPEMQVLDNKFHTDGKNSKTSAGALYDLIKPVIKNVKPAGEYNHCGEFRSRLSTRRAWRVEKARLL